MRDAAEFLRKREKQLFFVASFLCVESLLCRENEDFVADLFRFDVKPLDVFDRFLKDRSVFQSAVVFLDFSFHGYRTKGKASDLSEAVMKVHPEAAREISSEFVD